MKCNKCGKETPNNISNCIYCGYIFPKEKIVNPAKKEVTPNLAKERYSEIKNKNTESNKNQIIIASIISAILILAIIITSTLLIINSKNIFNPNITVDFGEQELTNADGIFDNLEFDIKSNQPIRSISYALNPEDPDNRHNYQRVKTGLKLFERTLKIDHLETPFGENRLYIRVVTFFGKENCEIILTRDVGYTSAPQEDAIVPISPDKELISNELVVSFNDSASKEEIKNLISSYDGEIVGENYLIKEYQIRFSGKGEEYINRIYKRLKKESIIDNVFFNISYTTENNFEPNDPNYDKWDINNPGGNNWGLEAINAPGAWDHINKLKTIRIGVIDSSLQYNHSDIHIDPNRVHILPTDDFKTIDDIENYYNKYENKHNCIYDYCAFCSMKDHGTHCTGIIGALGNNNNGVAGVSWNSEMYFTTAWYLNAEGEGQMKNYSTTEGFIYDITWLAANGCRVMNMSLGSAEASDPNNPDNYEINETNHYDKTFKKLQDAGYDFLLCKSAGNDNDDAKNYYLNRVLTNGETSKNHVIIVAAARNTSSIIDKIAAWLSGTNKIYNLDTYSNYGDMVDIAAPGTNIYSTVYGNKYQNMSGTSMATPMVAGVAGLVYGANPNLTSKSVKNILLFTSTDLCEKKLEAYYLVNAEKAVEWALNNEQNIPPREEPTLGFVTGTIQNAKTLDLIEDAVVKITDENSGETYGANTYDGSYEICLPPGTYTMQFEADKFLTETIYHVEVTANVVCYNILLNMVSDSSEKGEVSGHLINAFDGTIIPNANIEIYRGVNNTSGSEITEIKSDSNGFYSISLDPGNYTLLCSASGYMDSTANIISIGGESNTDQDCTLTPILNEGEMRVVLTWGRYPEDLDSHLIGPAPDGTFHTFYQNMNYSNNNILYDNLDVDDTNSYGPETTSVYVSQNGTYTFYVHNYSDRSSSTSSTLSTSGAQVKLYIAGQSDPIVYNVPNKSGTVWKVFSIKNGIVTPINTMSYETDPVNVGS